MEPMLSNGAALIVFVIGGVSLSESAVVDKLMQGLSSTGSKAGHTNSTRIILGSTEIVAGHDVYRDAIFGNLNLSA